MAWEITINKKKGGYNVWSTISDSYVVKGITRENLIKYYIERKSADAKEYMEKWLNQVDEGK